MQDLLDMLLSNTTTTIIITVAALLVVQFFVRHFIGLLIRRVIRSHHYPTLKAAEQREKTVTGILSTATAVLLWILGIFLILAQLNVNIGAMLTGAGLIGVIVGFGAQSTIKNLLAGIFIIMENQYRVGDIVTINGVSGIVEELTIRITRLRDLDGNVHIIQNGDIDIVTNRTFGYSNVNIDIGVSYDSDMDKVVRTIDEVGAALAADPEWADRIIEPVKFLRIADFADSAVIIKSLGKVAPGTQWDVAGEFRMMLKKAFDKAGIDIPLPQRVVHKPKK